MRRVFRVPRRLESSRFSAYAKLLEEAATAASADVGFTAEWYGEHASAWVIRRSTIECYPLSPVVPFDRDRRERSGQGRPHALSPGAEVEIATWVADFRRVRSRREYEVSAGGVLVIRAHTDWVYVDLTSGRPRRVPPEMIAAFTPDGAPQPMAREPLELPEPATEPIAVERIVAADDVDALGHVNNARYFDYLDESVREALGDQARGRAAFRARRIDLEYLVEALAGDRLRCATWIVRDAGDALDVATEIRRPSDATLLTRARGLWTRS